MSRTLNNQPTKVTFENKTIGLDYRWIRQTGQTMPGNVTTDYSYNDGDFITKDV